jgi:hypothetical protein
MSVEDDPGDEKDSDSEVMFFLALFWNSFGIVNYKFPDAEGHFSFVSC